MRGNVTRPFVAAPDPDEPESDVGLAYAAVGLGATIECLAGSHGTACGTLKLNLIRKVGWTQKSAMMAASGMEDVRSGLTCLAGIVCSTGTA